MNQAHELIAEANAHRERALIRGVDGEVIGDDPIQHAIADRALQKLRELSRNEERAELAAFESIPHETIPYALEEPLEFCLQAVVPPYRPSGDESCRVLLGLLPQVDAARGGEVLIQGGTFSGYVPAGKVVSP
jgi:hypothetical protein